MAIEPITHVDILLQVVSTNKHQVQKLDPSTRLKMAAIIWKKESTMFQTNAWGTTWLLTAADHFLQSNWFRMPKRLLFRDRDINRDKTISKQLQQAEACQQAGKHSYFHL